MLGNKTKNRVTIWSLVTYSVTYVVKSKKKFPKKNIKNILNIGTF